MLKDKSYKSRPFRQKDLKKVTNLRALVFGKDRAIKFEKNWKWYFRENPLYKAHKPRSWVVEHNNNIYGYISVTPGLLKLKDKKVKFVWGGDLMSHPEHRGKGIGKEMAKRWRQEHNIGIALGVGDVAYAIEHKQGWNNIPLFKAIVKILKPGNFLEYITKRKISRIFSPFLGLLSITLLRTRKKPSVNIAEVKRFDKRFDVFWKKVSANFNIAVVRDSSYLNWKYTGNPSTKFKIFAVEESDRSIKGYVVLSVIKSKGFRWGKVVDFVVDSGDKIAMQALISTTINHFKKLRCDAIQAYGMMPFHRDMFKKNGFIYTKKMDQRFIVKIDSYKGLPDKTYMMNPKNWFITPGDSDFSN